MAKTYTPIQIKLMRAIMLTCGMVLLLTCTSLFLYEYTVYRDIAKRELISLSEVVAANTTSSLAFEDKQDALEVLRSLQAQEHLVAALLFDNQGKLFASYPEHAPPRTVPPLPAESSFVFNGMFLEGFQPVVQGNKRLGTLYLISDLKAVNDRLSLYVGLTLLISLVSVIVAYLFSRKLRKTISTPILSLAETANAVSAYQNYAIRAQTNTNDEIGQLTHAFNHMLAQIEEKNAEILSLNQNLEAMVVRRTEQLQSLNTELIRQKDFVETILDASVDMIAVFDRDLRFVMLNKQADQVYSIGRDAIVGRKMTEVFPEVKNASIVGALQRAFEGHLVKEDLYKSPVSGRYFQNYFVPLRNAAGQVDQVLVIGHEITEVLETNARLKEANADLEKSNRELEQFAYVASHDLQEPLRKIQTFAELSERSLAQPDALKRYLQKISGAAERMSNLIKDVLNFSRLARVEGTTALVDLNAVLADVTTDLELLIEEKGVQLTATPLPLVQGNALQMHQLFYNLIGNAIKFSRTEPRVWIQAAVANPKELPSGLAAKAGVLYVELQFHDNGIGFEQQYADKVFSIFQRLHTAQEYAGTGIGLALCKKIAENHGGAITVKSEPGVGTCFFVYLPLPKPGLDQGAVLHRVQGASALDQ